MSFIIEKSMEAMLERSTDGVAILDRDGTCIYLNAAAGRMWERRPVDLIGKNIWKEYPEAVDQPFYQAYHRAREEQSAVHLDECDTPWKRWFETDIYPSADGTITLFFRDVTARHRAVADLAGERSLLRSIIDALPDAIYAKDTQYRFVVTNQAMADFFGLPTPDAIVGKSDSDFYPAEAAARFAEQERRILESGVADQVSEVVAVPPLGVADTPVRWVRGFKGPLSNERGEIVGLIGVVQDITASKKLEEKLRRQAQLFDQISDAVIVADTDFIIQSWNRAAENIYGWRADEVIGRPVRDILQTHSYARVHAQVSRRLDSVGHWEGEVEQRHKNGSAAAILSAISIVVDAQGQRSGVVVVNRDISALRKSEEQIRLAEQRYRHLFDEAPVMYLALDDHAGQLVVRDVNSAFLQALGYQRHEVIGHLGLEFLAEDSRQAAIVAHSKIRRGTVEVAERGLITHEGKRIDTLMRAVPEYDAGGQVTGILVMYTDISGRKEAERRQRMEAERVQTLLRIASRLNRQLDLEKVMQAVCAEVSVALHAPGVSLSLVDKETKRFVRGANVGLSPGYDNLSEPVPASSWLTGDLDTLELIEIVSIDSLTASPNYAMYVEQGVQYAVNVVLVRDGQLIGSLNLHMTDPARQFTPGDLALLRGFADLATQAILNAQLWEESQRHADDLESLVAERTIDLEVALAQAREADRLKTQFVSDINHELRTPLTNITLYLDLLTKGRPEKREHALAVIQSETLHLRQLIEEVLDLSRLDLGQLQVHARPTDLNQVVRASLAERDTLFIHSDLPVIFHPNEGLPRIAADPDLIQRAVTNLLSNALKYAQEGEVRIKVGRVCAAGAPWQTICVSDSGPGVSADDLPHLFERFYRGQAARQTGASGTGLGLAICHEIAERHGGRITIESEEGQGSTFTLWLPAA